MIIQIINSAKFGQMLCYGINKGATNTFTTVLLCGFNWFMNYKMTKQKASRKCSIKLTGPDVRGRCSKALCRMIFTTKATQGPHMDKILLSWLKVPYGRLDTMNKS